MDIFKRYPEIGQIIVVDEGIEIVFSSPQDTAPLFSPFDNGVVTSLEGPTIVVANTSFPALTVTLECISGTVEFYVEKNQLLTPSQTLGIHRRTDNEARLLFTASLDAHPIKPLLRYLPLLESTDPEGEKL